MSAVVGRVLASSAAHGCTLSESGYSKASNHRYTDQLYYLQSGGD